jgi:hypothetical protein
MYQWNLGNGSSHAVQMCSTRSWMTKLKLLHLEETHPSRGRGGFTTCKMCCRRHSKRTRSWIGRPVDPHPRHRLQRSEPLDKGDEGRLVPALAILIASVLQVPSPQNSSNSSASTYESVGLSELVVLHIVCTESVFSTYSPHYC